MEAIQKTTKTENNTSTSKMSKMYSCEIESIFDEVITAARSYNDDDQLSAEWYQYIRDTSNNTLTNENRKLIATDFA